MVGKHVPCRCLAFEDSQVVVAVDQRTGESGEEDGNLEIGHVGIALDDAVVVAVAVEEEQTVMLSEGDASLVENTIVQSDILTFGL